MHAINCTRNLTCLCACMCTSQEQYEFSFKNWCFFYSYIDHGVRSNSVLENVKFLKGYFAEFDNNFMCLMTYFLPSQKTYYSKICFKSLIFSKQNAVVLRFEIVSDKSFSVTPVFTTLILLPLFQIIKTPQCCGFIFTNFLFFLMATNALVTSWVTFLSPVFPIFWFDFTMVGWWK